MRVSAKAEYACVAMLELAANRAESQPVRIKAIADAHGIPLRFLVQILLQLKQFEQNVMVQIDNAVKTAQSKYESVQATRQARIYAEAALDAEQKTYAVGKATTFEVLQYQNSLTTARSAEIRALADYNEALAALAQQEGTTLEQYNVNLQAR